MHKLCERIERIVLEEYDNEHLSLGDMPVLVEAAEAMHHLAAYDLAKRQLDAQDMEMAHAGLGSARAEEICNQLEYIASKVTGAERETLHAVIAELRG